ncbi:MAG: DUF1464 family protein [Sulfolobales archaeon]|nr:DUF1464 family protein [Sulfolobales archaeon]MCX8209230.1 DUF1464 family protein [Sulfolobales archaeon]MDW8011070.1 DUF1464 family protein [Sulfolobales archaeon]
MRVVGVDPGTKTFDVVVVEDGKVVLEESFDTFEVARNPAPLVDFLGETQGDYVVAPSGYGAPVTRGDEVVSPRRFAVEVLLLSTERDIEAGRFEGEVGIWVYDALAKVVDTLVKKFRDRVLFLPGVVHLRTVPRYRKINKVDMGTVDKLASTFVAVDSYAQRYSADYEKVNVVVVELGYGYNAAVAVERGRVVDGVGGTYASVGTLTAGALDLEIVANTGTWLRWDVFHGGLFGALGVYELEKIVSGYVESAEPYYSVFNSFIEGVVKDVRRVLVSTPRAEAVILSGRHAKNSVVRRAISERVQDLDVLVSTGLRGSLRSKEAAQGYAAIGSGLAGGEFRELVKHMEIGGACGTAVDYVVHPRASRFVERVRRAYLESVSAPKICHEGTPPPR